MAENIRAAEQPPGVEVHPNLGPKMSFATVAAMAPPASQQKQISPSTSGDVVTRARDSQDSLGNASKSNPSRVDGTPTDLRDSFRRLDVNESHLPASNNPDNEMQPATHLRNRLDDEKTHLSISSTTAPSLDGKSVTSGATFALDEKESIRPDDSASVKAAEDDDSNSGPASGDPNSRFGSEAGGKAFSNQFNEISERMGPIGGKGWQWSRRLGSSMGDDARRDSLPSSNVLNSHPANATRAEAQPVRTSPGPNDRDPDEKLLEALENPKDRLFLLQLEKQVISFIQDSSDPLLDLAPCNSFYRLLAHRLGDYYALSHFVDNSVSAVRLYRTPYCQIRPSLSEIAQKFTAIDEARSIPPSMKIMRRAGIGSEDQATSSGANTNDQSAGASKAASEVGEESLKGLGVNSPAESTVTKEKPAISREEREAKYKEVRERIFRDYKESEKNEQTGGEDNGIPSSRASSTTSKKKKKQRPQDDGFDSRSAYNVYYPNQQRSGPIYDQGAGSVGYYNPYTGQPNAPMLPATYQQPYPQFGPMPLIAQIPGYHFSHQQYQMVPIPTLFPNATHPPQYTQYQQVPRSPLYGPIQSIPQQAAVMPHSIGSPALSTHSSQSSRPQSQMSEQGWTPPGYSFHYNGHHGTPIAYPAQPHSSTQLPHTTVPPAYQAQSHPSTQLPHTTATPTYPAQPHSSTQLPHATVPPAYHVPTVPYAYGQLPYHNGHGTRPIHPIPGSYNRQNFNPQSKVFVPGRSADSENPSSGLPFGHQLIGQQPPSLGPSIKDGSPSIEPPNPVNLDHSGLGQTARSPPPSTISKWATPATLPAKPPPPASSGLSPNASNTEAIPTFQNGTYSRPSNQHPKT